eukprot:tig00020563_g11246.t1
MAVGSTYDHRNVSIGILGAILAVFLITIASLIVCVLQPAIRRVRKTKSGVSDILSVIPRKALRKISRHYNRMKVPGAAESDEEEGKGGEEGATGNDGEGDDEDDDGVTRAALARRRRSRSGSVVSNSKGAGGEKIDNKAHGQARKGSTESIGRNSLGGDPDENEDLVVPLTAVPEAKKAFGEDKEASAAPAVAMRPATLKGLDGQGEGEGGTDVEDTPLAELRPMMAAMAMGPGAAGETSVSDSWVQDPEPGASVHTGTMTTGTGAGNGVGVGVGAHGHATAVWMDIDHEGQAETAAGAPLGSNASSLSSVPTAAPTPKPAGAGAAAVAAPQSGLGSSLLRRRLAPGPHPPSSAELLAAPAELQRPNGGRRVSLAARRRSASRRDTSSSEEEGRVHRGGRAPAARAAPAAVPVELSPGPGSILAHILSGDPLSGTDGPAAAAAAGTASEADPNAKRASSASAVAAASNSKPSDNERDREEADEAEAKEKSGAAGGGRGAGGGIFTRMMARYLIAFAALALIAIIGYVVTVLLVSKATQAASVIRYAGNRRYFARDLAYVAREELQQTHNGLKYGNAEDNVSPSYTQ